MVSSLLVGELKLGVTLCTACPSLGDQCTMTGDLYPGGVLWDAQVDIGVQEKCWGGGGYES